MICCCCSGRCLVVGSSVLATVSAGLRDRRKTGLKVRTGMGVAHVAVAHTLIGGGCSIWNLREDGAPRSCAAISSWARQVDRSVLDPELSRLLVRTRTGRTGGCRFKANHDGMCRDEEEGTDNR